MKNKNKKEIDARWLIRWRNTFVMAICSSTKVNKLIKKMSDEERKNYIVTCIIHKYPFFLIEQTVDNEKKYEAKQTEEDLKKFISDKSDYKVYKIQKEFIPKKYHKDSIVDLEFKLK